MKILPSMTVVLCIAALVIACQNSAVNRNGLCAAESPAVASQRAGARDGRGCLIIAHGFDKAWNDAVRQSVSELTENRDELFEICFLEDPAGNAGDSYITPQHAYDRLAQHGARQIIVMPLFVDSRSSHIDEVRFVTGLGELDHPEQELIDEKIQVGNVPITGMTRAIDGHPSIGLGLAPHVLACDDPSLSNYILLLAHGPDRDDEEHHWRESLDRIMAALMSGLPDDFAAETNVMTLRVHDPERYHERLEKCRARLAQYLDDGEVFLIYNHLRAGYMDAMVVRGVAGNPAFPGVMTGLSEDQLARLRHISTDMCDLGILPGIIRDRLSD